MLLCDISLFFFFVLFKEKKKRELFSVKDTLNI